MYKLPREVTLQIATPQAAKIYDTIGHHSATTEEIEPRLRDTTGHIDNSRLPRQRSILRTDRVLKRGIPGFTFSFTLTAITRVQPTGWKRQTSWR